jgi:hypothetical protein
MFLVEKKVFISYSKKPPLYTDKITTVVIRLMLFSLILHSLFAIFIYGEEALFTFSMKVLSLNGEVSIDDSERYDSFWSDLYYRLRTSLLFVILFLLTLFVLLMDIFFNDLIARSLKKKLFKKDEEENKGTYFEKFKILNYNDFPKYDFRLADEYVLYYFVIF